MNEPRGNNLQDRRVLIVEDEFLIADEMTEVFRQQGAVVVGPAATLESGFALLEGETRIDAAVLDINLRGEMAYRLADALAEKGIPFVFATGYDGAALPAEYHQVPRCEKPVDPRDVAKALF